VTLACQKSTKKIIFARVREAAPFILFRNPNVEFKMQKYIEYTVVAEEKYTTFCALYNK
jgi:hypothetical protein